MSKFTKKTWFNGIDISMEHIDVVLLNEQTPELINEKQFTNNLKGFSSMKQWMSKHNASITDTLFCMEHTGNYGLLLFAWLTQIGADFCVESGLQIKRSLGITRGKNDKVDAHRIATYALTQKLKIRPYVLASKNLVQLKQLLTYRDQLVRTRSGFKNSLKSHKQYEQLSDLDYVTKNIQLRIKQLTEDIDAVEKQISDIIDADNELKKNYRLATSVKGIGFVIAAFMLVTTNNFTSFDNGRRYACYSGIAPFENSSGKIKGKAKVSHLANKKMKTLLSNGANSAKSFDPELKLYYERKRLEGKEHKLIINAISCKLVNRVFAVVRRGSPFVLTYKNNFA